MQPVLRFLGWFVIVVGAIAAIGVISSLTVEVPYGYDLGTHTEPSPYRWYIGSAVFLSNCILGVFLLSIAEVIGLLSRIHNSSNQTK